MQVEDVTGVCFTSRRAAQQQGHSAVCFCLLRQVVEDDEDVLATVHPVLADSRTGVGCQVLEACCVRCGRCHDGGVLQRAASLKGVADSCNGGCLLANSHVDASNLLLGVTGSPVVLLVQNGVDRDSGLTGLAVTNDQLTLTATDRNHRVDCLQTGLQRLVNRLTLGHAGSLQLQCAAAFSLNGAQVIDRVTEGVNNATEVRVANGHREDLTGAVYDLALFNTGEVTQDNHTNIAGIQVLCEAEGAVFETKQLIRHHRGKALDASDTVGGRYNSTHLNTFCIAGFVRRCKLVQRITDIIGIDGQFGHLVSLLSHCGYVPSTELTETCNSGSTGGPCRLRVGGGIRRAPAYPRYLLNHRCDERFSVASLSR